MSNQQTSRMEERHRQKKMDKRKKRTWMKVLLGFGIAFLLMIIGCSVTVAEMIRDAPEIKADDLRMPQSTRIYDQNDDMVDILFHEENRVNISIDDVPDVVKDAIISIEDKRFYEHQGIDLRRLVGAVRANIKDGWGSEGGSTITQQVIKRTLLTPEKTLKRKVQEAWLALKLEKEYSKDEILELYINNVYFGHGAYGLKTASATYFGEEDLSELNVSQAALLAGLPNSPSATDPFKHPERAEERRNQVLSAMKDNNMISEEEWEQAKNITVADIILEEEKRQENDNPYNAYVDVVYEQLVEQEKLISEEEFFQGGLKIYTYLDADAQQAIDNLLHSDDIPYPDENFEAGLSLVDTEMGTIQAIGGGRHFKAIRYANYGTYIKHQPGSVIKPILDYGPAIEYLNWPTSHVLSDEPYQYSDGTPINEWDGEYWGDVSIRRALEWSRNIPALKAFQMVGKDKAQAFASGLGIEIDPIHESASIGGFDGVSPLEMAAAYAAFGNGGTYHEPSAVAKVIFPDGDEWEPELESHDAMKDSTAYMVTDMLKTVMTSGTGTRANVEGIPVAGKTGSTNIPKEDREKYGIEDGLRDAWFAGYTTDYSLAVWTGYPSFKNEDGDVQYIQYDGTQDIAKQLFRELMSEISSADTEDFTKPDSVVSVGSELHVRGAGTQENTEEQSDAPEQDQEQEEERDGEQEQEEIEEDDQEKDEAEDEKEDETEKEDEQEVEQEEEQNEQETDDEEQEEEEEQEDEEQSGSDEEQQDSDEQEDEEEDQNQDNGNEDEEDNDDENDDDEETNEDDDSTENDNKNMNENKSSYHLDTSHLRNFVGMDRMWRRELPIIVAIDERYRLTSFLESS